MSFPRYPKYKDSGVEWLGQVPEHWEIGPYKRMVEIQNGADHKQFEQADGFPVYGSGGRFAFASGYLYDGESVLLGRKGTIDRPLYVVGRFWTVDTMYWTKIRSCTSGKYAYYAATTIPFGYYSTSTALPSMTQSALGNHLLSLPPLPEQHAIAAFLDRETAHIDALVAEQERLIELLREKRQAVISHAVTKGLDPSVPMKDSGVEWLGEVPGHWGVTPLHHVVEAARPIMYGIVLPGPDVGSGIPILKGGNVRPHRMRLTEVAFTTAEIEAPYARARLRQGDLVYSIRGTIGDCEPVPQELEGANITQDVARVAVAPEDVPSFIRWALLSSPVREELSSGSLGAAVRGVNIFDLKRARILTPPRAERLNIAEFLNQETARIDALIVESESAITLLQERRSALISAAVTGQIDVSGQVQEASA